MEVKEVKVKRYKRRQDNPDFKKEVNRQYYKYWEQTITKFLIAVATIGALLMIIWYSTSNNIVNAVDEQIQWPVITDLQRKIREYNSNSIDPELLKPTVAEIATVSKKDTVHMTDDEVINEAIKLMHKFEWVRYEAYFDYKQWSICYWTKSFKWEVTTQAECDKRLKERVQSELLRINRLADNLEGHKKAALISFFYNTWFKSNVLNYARRWDDKSVVYLMSLYNVAGNKKLNWLVSRRNAEIKVYKGL